MLETSLIFSLGVFIGVIIGSLLMMKSARHSLDIALECSEKALKVLSERSKL